MGEAKGKAVSPHPAPFFMLIDIDYSRGASHLHLCQVSTKGQGRVHMHQIVLILHEQHCMNKAQEARQHLAMCHPFPNIQDVRFIKPF